MSTDKLLSSARNFGAADYEALLELDKKPPAARLQLSEVELGRLQTHIHHLKAEALPKRPPRLMPGSASSCTDRVGKAMKAACIPSGLPCLCIACCRARQDWKGHRWHLVATGACTGHGQGWAS